MGINERNALINLAITNKGDWKTIFKDIQDKRMLSFAEPNCKESVITLFDNNYPEVLKNHTQQPPFVLFYKGDLSLLKNDNIISIVGSRFPKSHTIYAMDKLVNGTDVAIIGGEDCLIDKIARPIVVLGCGLNIKQETVDAVVKKGGLVLTEYPSDVLDSAANLASRNRIIEGLAHKTLVLDCTARSSGTIRIMFSLNLGHDVYVVPTSLDLSSEYDNNKLILEGAIPCIDRQQLYEKQV